jgi:hypothetical protein
MKEMKKEARNKDIIKYKLHVSLKFKVFLLTAIY